jgi:hypothetical protein
MFINAVAEFPELNLAVRQASARHKNRIRHFLADILGAWRTDGLASPLAAQFSLLLDGAIVAAQIEGDPQAAFLAWRAAVRLLRAEGIEIDAGDAFS